MQLIRTITLAGFTGDTWAVPGDQSGPPGGFPLAVAVAAPGQPSPFVSIRWRIIPYDAGGAPITDSTTTINALAAFLESDSSGQRTVALGPSLVDCKGAEQLLGLTLLDSAKVGDVIAFAIPSLTDSGTATTLRIFSDYGAVPQ